jgi:hypothetical protein
MALVPGSAATIDLEHDRAAEAAKRRVEAPLLALWGKKEPSGTFIMCWRHGERRRPASAVIHYQFAYPDLWRSAWKTKFRGGR